MTLKFIESKNCHCTRCGKYCLCFPHDESRIWLCSKCKEKWRVIYQTRVKNNKGINEFASWDIEFKIFLNDNLGKREKVSFT